MRVIIQIDRYRRIILYEQKRLDLKIYIKGVGWVLDNDAEIPDHVIQGYLDKCRDLASKPL